ncbi:hypothetical protein [Nocardioides sp. YIM 152588]|uniref:hypothetical protein n=1 Tax=Nocardioides sp. YIM 152588 TaxID=3158259 RepID=UPI0032E3DC79
MPRRNYDRRAKALRARRRALWFASVEQPLTYEDMARDLVRRGLASRLILGAPGGPR